ncbi:MAG TPA: hypothetical protein ENH91_08585, partial [Leeuwenhoekiella sp.]|nr:hypothetical protein [Leeuwenhoekiella sp.]
MKTKIILGLTVGLLLFYSCSDEYLQDEKRDGLSSDVVFASDETASAAIIGVYDVLQGSPAEYITKAIFYPANFLTQDYLNIGSDTFFQTFEIPTVFAPFNALWTQNYAGIGRANTALESLEPAIEAGNDILNFTRVELETAGGYGLDNAYSNIGTEYFNNRWTTSNPSNEY